MGRVVLYRDTQTHNAVERFDDFDSDENVSVSTDQNAEYIIYVVKTNRLIDSSGNDVCLGNLVKVLVPIHFNA